MELFKLVGKVALEGTDTVNNELNTIGTNGENAESRLTGAFKKIGAAAATYFAIDRIVAFGKNVIGTTQTFSDSMLKVQSLSGATGEEFDKLKEKALEYGSKTAWTSSQVADAMGYMALAGFDTNEIMGALNGTLGLASASGTDLATTSDILTDAITAFGYKAQDANLFADVLATTQAKSNTTVELLGESFKYVGSLAGTYGYKVESVSTALGLMANAGVKGSMAGTSLASIITRLATNTHHARDTIEALGIQFYNSDGTARDLSDVLMELSDVTAGMTAEQKAEIASTIAGQEAQKGLLAILNQGSGTYAELQNQLKECSGTASDMSTNMESGIGGAIRTVQSAWEGFKIRLGQKFEPALTNALQTLAGFVTNTLVPAMDGFIGTISNIIGWLNSGSTSAEVLKGTVEVLTAAFIAFKAGAAIQGVINGFQEAQVALSLFKLETEGASIAQGLLNGSLTIGQTIVGLLTGQVTLAEIATGLWAKTQAVLNAVMSANPIGLIIMAIAAVIAIIVVLYNKCDWFRNAVQALFGWLTDAFTKVIDFFKNNWQGILLFLVNPFAGGFKLLYDNFEGFRNFVDGIVAKIKSIFNTVIDFFKNNWQTILLFIINPFAGAFKFAYEKCEGFRNFVNDTIEKIKNILSVGIQFIGQLFNLAIDIILIPWNFIWVNFGEYIVEAINKVKEWLTEAWNFISSIITAIWEFVSSIINAVVSFVSSAFTSIYSDIANKLTEAWNFISNIFNQVYSFISDILNQVANYISSIFTEIYTAISNKVTEIYQSVVTVFTNVKDKATEIFNSVKERVSSIFTNIKDGITNKVNEIRNTVTNVFNAIKTAISTPIQHAAETVKGVVEKIKSFFHFEVKLPNIKLPHFAIQPAGWKIGDLLEGSVPKLGIDWYAKAMDKGMILDKPTIFGLNSNGMPMGAGEAGSETVVGTNSLRKMIQEATKESVPAVNNSGIEEKLDKVIDLMQKLKIYLDDEVVGEFVVKTVEREVFN